MSFLFNPGTLTIASTMYTYYKVHPYVPYRFIWENMVLPAIQNLKNKGTSPKTEYEDHDTYEVIQETGDGNGVVTRVVFFDTSSTQFTYIHPVEL